MLGLNITSDKNKASNKNSTSRSSSTPLLSSQPPLPRLAALPELMEALELDTLVTMEVGHGYGHEIYDIIPYHYNYAVADSYTGARFDQATSFPSS